jgi:EAL domain-containing protein (putative c-di-GMP-specific phosphodiesterase class I)
VTRWVLNATLRQVRIWMDQGVELPVAVNLSAHDFDDPHLPTYLRGLLHRWNVPASLLSVEITETAVLAGPTRAKDVLNRLAGIGVRAALDDFGIGYSSLRAIQQLALHELKIDRSFVRDVTLASRDRAIVASTIQLGQRLGLNVVAEGVEDRATFELLKQLGCDMAQGYLFAEPMPAEDLVEWIARSGGAPVRSHTAGRWSSQKSWIQSSA